MAIAVCYAGWHFGGLTLAPLAQYLIDSAGWRHACLILAGLIVIVALPPMLLFGSRRPAGALPPEEAIPTPEAFGPDVASPSAFRSGAFWLVVAMTVLCSFTYGGLLTHEVALIEDAGISPAMAFSRRPEASGCGVDQVTSTSMTPSTRSSRNTVEPAT